jgi:phosphoglycerate dehydrogenase-like enzyme
MSDFVETLITIPFADALVAQLNNISSRLKINIIKTRKVEEIPADVWQRAEVLYTNMVLPLPEQVPNLRWLQFHWTGIDHAISHPLLQKPGLVITNLSGVGAPQMAEYAAMMVLALGHRLPELMAHQKRSEWPKDRWERFSPREVRGSTVGIVGYGSVGRQVAHLLHDFGATLLATKRDVLHPADTGYIPEGTGDPEGDFIHRMYPPQAVSSMLKECDFVVVTVPLTIETRNMIGAKELAALKPTAFLIDVSRGGIIDHTALFAALRDQKIAGAALDVFPEEPLPPDSPLWKMPNVILTPHISGDTPYYDERAVAFFIENLHRYLAGLSLYNRVDVSRGY